ncbi:4-amino-4-deoxy-L-arabinose transferase-like glycosyltransferase [Actinoplanes octamycinicus]|uniref:4-amino-4-deoxy-L-arabinose transferase-like glycosyltransferase n=1 Tax=Actinoplanes octamycinicus TaxID=135948 RepID=A0A7W7MCL1_9ACTN|nr:phospholipid carrier-dependent glycosyltransferase [Actinoplanes octamycinicus]MBB4745264.1 4-amino-4-deoxy-L-arabinose transferase-like glycosyltransferase [Actinoplanes octamycinicus]GIE62258.1 glycosyl transferase [Actinoplanes octamycinicus]
MTTTPLAEPRPVVPAATDGVPEKNRAGRADLALAAGLTAVIVTLLAWNITGFPSASDDEGTYLAQAWAVQHGRGLAHYTYWYDHPPLAWIQLAGLSWIPEWLAPGLTAVAAGRIAMLPVQAAGLLLVYLVGRRIGLPRWAASLALLTYGLSPLYLTMGRQIYLDSFAVVWILGALALALSPRRHLWHFAAAGGAAAVAILSKETIAVVLPAVLLALWQSTARSSTRPWAIGAFVSGLVLVGCFYPLYAVLRGELFPGPGHVSLIGAWQFQLGSRSGSGSVFSAGSGASSLLQSWLYYDAVILVAGAVASVAGLALRRVRPVALAGVILIVVALRPGGYLPAMYVVQVLPFFAIAIAGVLASVVAALPPAHVRWRWAVLGVAVAMSVAVVAPRWYVGDRRALSTDDNAPYAQAAGYLQDRLPGRAGGTVVVDDVLWLDCVDAGYPPDKVIWFYKLDLDSAVAKRLPGGWRDVDYVVSTPAMRQDPNSLPTVRALLANSTVIASFGPPDGLIEIRRVDKELS